MAARVYERIVVVVWVERERYDVVESSYELGLECVTKGRMQRKAKDH